MKYLLDTNVCIALINGTPPLARTRFQKTIDSGTDIFISTVAISELWYGVAKSRQRKENTKRLKAFFSAPVILLPFGEEDAQSAGSVRATLEATGKPIGAYDLLMAGQALHWNLTLVTANIREFGRIKGLIWEDWTNARY